MALTGKQRQHLRGLAHHLDPVVHVGHEGLTEAVFAQVAEALEAHELIKVKLGKECPVEREVAATSLSASARAEVVQVIGRTVVVFRKQPRKAKPGLPGGDASRDSKAKRGKEASKGRPPRVRRKTKRRAK